MSASNSFAMSALRVVVFMVAAFAATVVCFYVMYMLIAVEQKPVESKPLKISAALTLDYDSLQTRDVRKKPEKMLPMEPPPGPDLVSELRNEQIAAGKSTLMHTPAEVLDPMAKYVRFKPLEDHLVAVKVVRPEYPLFAVTHQIEGHVVVHFFLNEDGSVHNPLILESEPSEVFDMAALRAIRQFRFRPPEIESELVMATGMLRFAFELESRQVR